MNNSTNIGKGSRNATNNTTISPWCYDQEYEEAKLWIRGITALVILTGNTICLAAFLGSKSLRKRPHYLLIHLCLADFLVGISVVLRLLDDALHWLYGDVDFMFASFIYSFDYFSSIASIYVLMSISIERFLAIVFPLFHRMAGKGIYTLLMGIPWFVTSVTTVTYIYSNRIQVITLRTFNLVYFTVCFFPVIVIFLAYFALFIRVKRNHLQGSNQSQGLRDRKLAVTLLLVTLASILTWGPYNLYAVMRTYSGVEYQSKILFALIILQYWNSGINVAVYFYRMPQFRQVVQVCCRQRQITPHVANSGANHPNPVQLPTESQVNSTKL